MRQQDGKVVAGGQKMDSGGRAKTRSYRSGAAL